MRRLLISGLAAFAIGLRAAPIALRSADSQLRNAALTWAYDLLIRRPMPGRAVPDVVLQQLWTAAQC